MTGPVLSDGDAASMRVRPAAVAGAFYPDDPRRLTAMIDEQLDYARHALERRKTGDHLRPWPKAIIVPHAGYIYSGTTAALAYALLERGRGTVRRAVIVGPTHRVAVRGVACCTADAFATPLGTVPVDVASELRALGMIDSPQACDVSARGSSGTSGTDGSDSSAGLSVKPPSGSSAGPARTPRLRSGMTAAAGAPAPALIVNDPTHAREHAVEVQIPFLQRVLGDDIEIVPLNAGLATPRQVGDVLRALWGGPETVIVISSDLSHYHAEHIARELDDETIRRVTALDYPIDPDLACGAYPINGLLDVLARQGRDASPTADETAGRPAEQPGIGNAPDSATPSVSRLTIEFLGCSTSGDAGEVALAGEERPAMDDPYDRVVGYASWAVWQCGPAGRPDGRRDDHAETDRGAVLLDLADAALREYLGVADDGGPRSEDRVGTADDSVPSDHDSPVPKQSVRDILAANPWLDEPGASFVTLTKNGRLRGCIGTLEAYRPLGRDVAAHAVDAAVRDPRFWPVTAREYPELDIEVSVLSTPEPMPIAGRDELERTLRPGVDGLVLADRGGRHRATFLPQVWDELPDPHDFVSHLLAKAGLPASYDWRDGEMDCRSYQVAAYHR